MTAQGAADMLHAATQQAAPLHLARRFQQATATVSLHSDQEAALRSASEILYAYRQAPAAPSRWTILLSTRAGIDPEHAAAAFSCAPVCEIGPRTLAHHAPPMITTLPCRALTPGLVGRAQPKTGLRYDQRRLLQIVGNDNLRCRLTIDRIASNRRTTVGGVVNQDQEPERKRWKGDDREIDDSANPAPGAWAQSSSGLVLPAAIENGSKYSVALDIPEAPATLMPYVVGAAPIVVPLIVIAVVGDPAILRVLLARGSLVALFVAMVQPFLPAVVGVTVFVAFYRFTGQKRHFLVGAIAALALSGFLMAFVPVTVAIPELGFVASYIATVWPRRRHRRNRVVMLAMLLALAPFMVGVTLWGQTRTHPFNLPVSITGRALYALPREVAIYKNGAVRSHYLVATDEHFTTVIMDFPAAVFNFRTTDIALRLPCRHHERGASRSLASLIFGQQQGGTAYCEELSACLLAIPRGPGRPDDVDVQHCLDVAMGL